MKNTNVRQNRLPLTSWLWVDDMALQGYVSRAKKSPRQNGKGIVRLRFLHFSGR